MRESVAIIRAGGSVPAGVVIALDRQERGAGRGSAVEEVVSKYGISVISVARLDDLTEFLAKRSDMKQEQEAIRRYRERYGS